MKLKQILSGGLVAILLASCSNDLPSPDDGKVLENETTTYVRVSLVGDNVSSRAEGAYENGSADENEVNRILLVFFDAGRHYVGRSLMEFGENNPPVSVDGTSNTVEKILTVVAPVKLPENINYPRYVVALVNPTSAYGDLAVDKLEDMMGMIRQRSEVSHTGTRSMNNSAYFNTETGNLSFATEVDFHTHFFQTMEDAMNATDATVEITVERVEAKVRLSNALSDLNPKPYESTAAGNAEAYTLEFVPEAWFVNGTEKRTFLLKNYRSTRKNYLTGHMTEEDFGMNLSQVKEAFLNGGDHRENEVNDAANLRSYWAIDPTYFILTDNSNNLYPEVSYDVQYGPINPSGNVYPLQYRSYANVLKEKSDHVSTSYVKFNETVKTCEYVLENTLSYQTLKSTNAKAAMGSVVLLGHYMVKNAAGEIVFDGTTTDKGQSFYVRHEANNSRIVMISDQEAMDFFLERTGNTFCVQKRDAEGKVIENEFEPLRAAHLKKNAAGEPMYGLDYDDFRLVYPNSSFTGDTRLSEQWRTLDLVMKNGKYNENLFIYDATMNSNTGGYRNIKETDAAEIASIRERMYSTYGVLEKFQTGKAYFNVPLKHIWHAGNSSNEFDAKNVVLGDYGVVRNHIYDLTINKIEGLGTGIGDIEQPIVPPTENEQYYINTRLRILQWRLVGQSVDL